MDHLEELSLDALQRALAEVDGKKPTKRLTAAIAYKRGVPQTELAEWYDVQRRTIYSWLKRLEGAPLAAAVRDDRRRGRPRKLSDDQQRRLAEALHERPTDSGYDAPTWTPALVRRFLDETFDVEYSRSSCRRLMKEAGLSYRKPRRTTDHVDSDVREETGGEHDGRAGTWMPR